MRHLRIMVAARDLRSLWSVLLPLVQRIINRTYKLAIQGTPHNLIHWHPTDLDRGIFAPLEQKEMLPPLKSSYVESLRRGYERLLDQNSLNLLEQAEDCKAESRDLSENDLVLVSYAVRPPSKLAARWAGPFRILERKENVLVLEDLTGGPSRTVDISRIKIFRRGEGINPQRVAEADLSECRAEKILDYQGDPRKRKTLSFQVLWSDEDCTWEPWENVKKLSIIDQFCEVHAELNYLKSK